MDHSQFSQTEQDMGQVLEKSREQLVMRQNEYKQLEQAHQKILDSLQECMSKINESPNKFTDPNDYSDVVGDAQAELLEDLFDQIAEEYACVEEELSEAEAECEAKIQALCEQDSSDLGKYNELSALLAAIVQKCDSLAKELLLKLDMQAPEEAREELLFQCSQKEAALACAVLPPDCDGKIEEIKAMIEEKQLEIDQLSQEYTNSVNECRSQEDEAEILKLSITSLRDQLGQGDDSYAEVEGADVCGLEPQQAQFVQELFDEVKRHVDALVQ